MKQNIKSLLFLVLVGFFASSFIEKKNGDRHLRDINCIAILELAADVAYGKQDLDSFKEFNKIKSDIFQSYPEGYLLSNQIIRSKVKHKARLKNGDKDYLDGKLFECGFTGKV